MTSDLPALYFLKCLILNSKYSKLNISIPYSEICHNGIIKVGLNWVQPCSKWALRECQNYNTHYPQVWIHASSYYPTMKYPIIWWRIPWRSLEDYSPGGHHKELDTTEQLTTTILIWMPYWSLTQEVLKVF